MKKVLSREELTAVVQAAQKSGKRVGFTSGVFDLLHAGHVSYLFEAKNLCDILIVGLNADDSVRRLKGSTRPICSQTDRAVVLAALSSVDYVFVFHEENNNRNIEILRPDIYIKAGDYDRDKLSSAKLVEDYGGQVKLVHFLKGRSTTAIVDKILTSFSEVEPKAAELMPRPFAPAVFLDRDGTLNEHIEHLSDPSKFKLLPGVASALKRLKDFGFRLVVVTNQPGIGLGYFTREDFFRVNREFLKNMKALGVAIDGIYFCPHSEAEACLCRKPRTGMFERATDELNLERKGSFIIGDSRLDIEAGKNLGIGSVIVTTGATAAGEAASVGADFVAGSLEEAASFIISQGKRVVHKSEPVVPVSRESLEALGVFAGKLGHDVNNLFGVIRGATDLLRLRLQKLLPSLEPVERHLKLIDTSLIKGVELTTKIRSFIRPGQIEKEGVRLAEVTQQVITALSGADVSFEFHQSADPTVQANRFAVSQVLAAICLNSIEAMAVLSDRHLLVFLDEQNVSGTGELPPGRYARVSVVDHGEGISEENLSKLLKSVFSTKGDAIGQGFGLSLPMAREAMRKHGGELTLSSAEDCGTAVHLYFPMT